ncbi:hypothetical protein [Ruminococcus sp.]|uniref:hypothetical protein n=1 Tax=Ruminococcus sp. TaxID=41978 RepID=UPI0025F737B6|nr:hypothetical protein [Ruminococcus sp.]MBQ8966993.1 hypothetical protein [Ruminococcus sp.]
MTAKKGRRKFLHGDRMFYWYIKVDSCHRIIIYSEDKKTRIEAPFPDTEVPVTPKTIGDILDKYLK